MGNSNKMVLLGLLFFKVDLPDAYSPWTLVARNLPMLIENGQLREEVEKV